MKRYFAWGVAIVFGALPFAAGASADVCNQSTVDANAPKLDLQGYRFIPEAEDERVQPFYQWESNNGYCGETSMIEAALLSGEYMSQYNARRLCATGLDQAGVCRGPKKQNPNVNAELLLEPPGEGASGPNLYASAPRCLANARLDYKLYPFKTQPPGKDGQKHFLSWVKQEVINGHHVTLGVMMNKSLFAGEQVVPQYDHIVSVIKIATRHDPQDPSYYDDDILYFDDHGVKTTTPDNPAIPPGAGATAGCTPYVYAYRFDQIGRSRGEANDAHAPLYSILKSPENANASVWTITGMDGYGVNAKWVRPHNYAFSVAGPLDLGDVPDHLKARPVKLTIESTSTPFGMRLTRNPYSPRASYRYENPMIGTSNFGDSCTNAPPSAWMQVVLRATVKGLTEGRRYNCYRYASGLAPVSSLIKDVALRVPTAQFNARSAMADYTYQFRATGAEHSFSFTTTSDKANAIRCVDVAAP